MAIDYLDLDLDDYDDDEIEELEEEDNFPTPWTLALGDLNDQLQARGQYLSGPQLVQMLSRSWHQYQGSPYQTQMAV